MYGSYGSYSSMGAMSISAPMDITSSNMIAHDRSCAFPSWPRRDSLTSSESDRPTSYLSDEDLFLPDTFEDDSHSISGASSTTTSPPRANADNFLELERQREAMQREAALRYSTNEKERRRQQAARRQRAMGLSRPSSSKKGSKSKLASMTSVAESAVFED